MLRAPAQDPSTDLRAVESHAFWRRPGAEPVVAAAAVPARPTDGALRACENGFLADLGGPFNLP